MKKIIYTIHGMHCASCKALIEDVAHDVPQVKSATVDLEKNTAMLEVEDDFDSNAFMSEVQKLGDYTIMELI